MKKKVGFLICIALIIGLSGGYFLGLATKRKPSVVNVVTVEPSYQTWKYEGKVGKGESYLFSNITTGGYREVSFSIWVLGPQLGLGKGYRNATIMVNIGFGPEKGISRGMSSFQVRTEDGNVWKTYPVVGAFMTVRIENFEDTSATFSCWIYATT